MESKDTEATSWAKCSASWDRPHGQSRDSRALATNTKF